MTAASTLIIPLTAACAGLGAPPARALVRSHDRKRAQKTLWNGPNGRKGLGPKWREERDT